MFESHRSDKSFDELK